VAKKKNSVTIYDVAQHVGLAKSTVAFVMSGKAESVGLAKKTVKRVEAAAKELGYVPNYWATSLARQSTDIVTVLMDVFASYYGEQTMHSISQTLTEKGYFPFMAADWRDPILFDKMISAAIQRRDAGIICHSSTGTIEQYMRIIESEMPLVFVGDIPKKLSNIPQINCAGWDDGQAVETAIRHLVDTGRRKIAFVGADHGYDSDDRRLTAYEKALSDAGLEVKPEWQAWFRVETPGLSPAKEILEQLFLQGTAHPDAILTINPAVAQEILRGTNETNIRIPEKIALITLCDCPTTEFAGITAVREPVWEQARAAAEILIELIESPDRQPLRKIIPCNELLIRKTTAV